jgi:TolB protein
MVLVIALSGCDRQVTPPGDDAFDAEPSASVGAAGVGLMTYLIGLAPDFDIYVGFPDGTGLVDVSMNDVWDTGPRLSPNGRQIAFYRVNDAQTFDDLDIYVMDVDGSDVRRLTTHGTAANPTWSASGRQIAFESEQNPPGYDIWVIDADGTDAVDITNSDWHDFGPVWSPNGRQIAFMSDRDHTNDEWDIYVMDADGSNARRLTTASGFPIPWSWSPDGKRILFYRDGSIIVANADGSGETVLTSDPAFLDAIPSYSPNGRFIAFSRDPVGPGAPRPYVMNADGSDVRPIPVPAPVVAGRLAHPYDWSHR